MNHPTDEQKLSPELKAKWVAALRSGKYKQGRGYLRTKADCFCCLGVLADIHDSSRWADLDDGDDEFYYDPYHANDGYDGNANIELHAPLCRVLGLSTRVATDLVSLNDGATEWNNVTKKRERVSEPKSFAEIADYIEANL